MEIFQTIIVVVFGLTAIAGALFMVVLHNPVRAAMGLLLTMVSIGVIFITIGAHFVGFVQVIVYAGAIVILFLFAVMHFPVGKIRRDRIPMTKLVGIILLVILGVTLLMNGVLAVSAFGGAGFAERNFNDTLEIGQRFLSDWIYPFELVSVLMLIALIASVHLTRTRSVSTPDDGGEEK